MVPFPRDSLFVGRENILAQITEDMSVQQGRLALVGIGGVGKSQIAIEYCYRYRLEHADHHILWAMCSNFNRFEEAYKNIARKLNLPVSSDKSVDALQVVLEWLNENGPWLMVLDNADDKDILFGLDSPMEQDQQQKPLPAPLAKYIPYSSSGAMLITTRDRSVGESIVDRPAKSVTDVMPFGVDDARQLLRNRFPDSGHWSEAGTLELLEHLNYLPLAISQATAYIREERTSLSTYLGLISPGEDDAKVILERSFYDPGRDYEIRNSIFQTWTLSFEQIKRRRPRAAEILSLMAFLDRQAVSDSLLRNTDEGNVKFNHAISTLKSFSLIAVTGDNQGSYQMHRLVQIATQRWLENEGSLPQWQEKALAVVIRCCPPTGRYEYWKDWEAVNPHVQTVLGYNFTRKDPLVQRARLLHLVAEYENYQSRYTSAEARASEAAQLSCEFLGDEDGLTLASLSDKALALGNQGNAEEAENIYRHVLDSRKRILGDEDELTLQSMNGVAEETRHQYKYEEAKTLQRKTLAICQRKLGLEHTLTIKVMTNLAGTMGESGEIGEAQALLHQALELYQKVALGDDPDAFYCMHELAPVCQKNGKYEKANDMFRVVPAECERGLPEDHYYTLIVRNFLGLVLNEWGQELQVQGKQGEAILQFEDAEQLYRSAFASTEKKFGPNAPFTLAALGNIAVALFHQQKYDQAEDIDKLVLNLCNELHGPNDQKTLSTAHNLGSYYQAHQRYQEAVDILQPWQKASMNNLGVALARQRKFDEAEELCRKTVELRQKVLGKAHAATILSMDNLQWMFVQSDRPEEAVKVLREMLVSTTEAYGPEDQRVLTIMHDLGCRLTNMEKFAEAEDILQNTATLMNNVQGEKSNESLDCNNDLVLLLLNKKYKKSVQGHELAQRIVTRRTELLGKEHVQTLWMSNCLAVSLPDPAVNGGDYTEAEEQFKKNIKLQSKVLGDGHANTLLSLQYLTWIYFLQGKFQEAEELRGVEGAKKAWQEWEKAKEEAAKEEALEQAETQIEGLTIGEANENKTGGLENKADKATRVKCGRIGLGMGGQRRGQKLYFDNIKGITDSALRRLARRGDFKRIRKGIGTRL
ncbi:hypothetical protein OEA41_000640 [Lepraria neglecta]|uniref:TPR-like protein n=1 Tax=Lepraria neglecta TaxID=209136 RepID=A0AAD9ZGL9_9LECA|nr:hypothetical protein OEA41_000640 [Lepraria neglecta]